MGALSRTGKRIAELTGDSYGTAFDTKLLFLFFAKIALLIYGERATIPFISVSVDSFKVEACNQDFVVP